ncbi:MAG: hypothetical protein ABJM86_10175 [Hyphomicrobiales bacterium]
MKNIKKRQLACKPGFVWPVVANKRGNHSSWCLVAKTLTQPTRTTGLETALHLLKGA